LRVKKEGHLWLAKGRNDWYPELRIGPRQFDKAIKVLVSVGVVEKKVFKFAGNPTIHIRVHTKKFLELVTYHTEANFDATLQGEEEFRDEEDTFRGMAGDLGMEEADADASASLLAHVENSFSPIGENHNIDSSLSKRERELDRDLEEKEKPTHVCPRCGSMRVVSESVDAHRRCALCMLVDTWDHYIGVKGLQYRTEDGVRIYSTEISKDIHKKMEARLKSKDFRRAWIYAIQRAGRMKSLLEPEAGWFSVSWLVSNNQNHQKLTIEKKYDWKEKRNYPSSYQALLQWERQLAAGVAS